MKQLLYILLPLMISTFLNSCQNKPDSGKSIYKADVIIYGGTSAAVTTAVQVVKMGKTVIVVSPDKHLGGLSASGLGWIDTGKKETIGGLSREFYQRIYSYYDKPETWKWQLATPDLRQRVQADERYLCND